jgi:hypothetical protein
MYSSNDQAAQRAEATEVAAEGIVARSEQRQFAKFFRERSREVDAALTSGQNATPMLLLTISTIIGRKQSCDQTLPSNRRWNSGLYNRKVAVLEHDQPAAE